MISLSMFRCDGCGACCRTFPIIVSDDDAVREPKVSAQGQREPGWTVSYCLNPGPGERPCCFLDSNNSCLIYESRPKICRDFAPGGDLCQEARKRQSLPPLSPSI